MDCHTWIRCGSGNDPEMAGQTLPKTHRPLTSRSLAGVLSHLPRLDNISALLNGRNV